MADHAEGPVQPPPLFLMLPGVAHSSIGSFLGSTSLRVSEACRDLINPYGSSLTSIQVRYVEDSSAGRLATLLHCNTKLNDAVVNGQEALPAFCQAIVNGCCHGVTFLRLVERNCTFTKQGMSLLAGALEENETLPMLRRLHITNNHACVLSVVARTLAVGAVPQLQELVLDTRLDDNDLETFVYMIKGPPETIVIKEDTDADARRI